jgi:hypothetical protein
MNKEEARVNEQEIYESLQKVADYAKTLNNTITTPKYQVGMLKGIRRMLEGKEDPDVRNGQYGKFTDAELGKLYIQLVKVHKWPEQ